MIMTSVKGVAASLRALLSNVIDYAALYPPAALPLPIVVERYRSFLASPDAWILNRLVLPADRLSETRPGSNWRITLLVDAEPGTLPPQVETLEIKSALKLSLPTYCEAPIDEIAGAFAKVRTGGLLPDDIPSPARLPPFLCRAAERRMPCKATAGLHHAVRSDQPLTNTTGGPHAVMHGFLNVFTAAAFAWHGAQRGQIEPILDETDTASFHFSNDALDWRGYSLDLDQIQSARRDFAHSF